MDGMKVKGRGARERDIDMDADRYQGRGAVFDQLDADEEGPCRSVEGYVIIVTSVHEEIQEDEVFEAFSEYGEIKNLHLNLDRRTGFVKGYCFIEYGTVREANDAISAMHGQELLGQNVNVDWAFSKPADSKRGRRGRK
jgi:RNA-binding protein 8A